jgi:phosphoribosyl-ATP pyrophosphohydrolase/phosphoribosyl-AMP cyclohydrolase
VSPSSQLLGLADLDRLDFVKGRGLLPAVIQHPESGAVLMLGYMNREALEATLTRGRVVFFSRSRQRLWEKGETSGRSLEVEKILSDCDGDALLVTARPKGPACHLGTATCFGDGAVTGGGHLAFFSELERVIGERIAERPEGSYTAKLVASGVKRMAQKVGEEGLEMAMAAVSGPDDDVVAEAADLFYHVLVLLKARGLSFNRVTTELRERHQTRP